MLSNIMIKFTGLIADPSSQQDNRVISLESYHDDLIYPKTGINVLYGKTTLQEFQEIVANKNKHARDNDRKAQHFEMVEISCLGLRHQQDLHWFDHYQNKSIFDLRRLSAQTRQDINQGISVKQEILEIFYQSALKDYSLNDLKQLGCIHSKTGEPTSIILEKMPQYIDALKKNADWMENIDALIWSAKSSGKFDEATQSWSHQAKTITRATLFNAKCIVMTLAHHPEYSIAPLNLPSIITPISMRRVRRKLGT